MISAKGHNGTVHFDGRFVTIERKGLFARASVGKGDKRIRFDQTRPSSGNLPGR
jgi:hypothetical protein